ncbi:hypothetical protein IAU60_001307 [Kwoniella sp. DSM 27419]
MTSAGPSRRADGRAPTQLRTLHISIDELDRADGSGRFAFGPTASLASCTGPIEVRLREERPDRATLEITHRPLEGVGATPSRALVTSLEAIYPPVLKLSQHPRSLIQLVVQSLTPTPVNYSTAPTPFLDLTPSDQAIWPRPYPEDDHDVSPTTSYTYTSRAAAINASTLALLSAGSVPLTALPIAVALANVKGSLVLDPSTEEEQVAKARFGFGWAFGVGVSLAESGADVEMKADGEAEQEMELVWTESEGTFSKEEFSNALELSKMATRQILSDIREALGEHLTRKA